MYLQAKLLMAWHGTATHYALRAAQQRRAAPSPIKTKVVIIGTGPGGNTSFARGAGSSLFRLHRSQVLRAKSLLPLFQVAQKKERFDLSHMPGQANMRKKTNLNGIFCDIVLKM